MGQWREDRSGKEAWRGSEGSITVEETGRGWGERGVFDF